jgi:chemotaxis protein MotB
VARKQKKHEHVNHERWLVSYADFITLLFAFFVVMFAVSQVDSGKLGRFAEGVQVAFQMRGIFPDHAGSPLAMGGGGGNSIVPQVVSERRSFLTSVAPSPRAKAVGESREQELAARGSGGEVALRYDPRGVVVSLEAGDFFQSGSAQLRSGAPAALGAIAESIAAEDCPVLVEAHVDELEAASDRFPSGWELSAARAARVVRFLVDEAGFEPERLSAAGFAEFRPLSEDPEQNRRVDLVLVTESAP